MTRLAEGTIRTHFSIDILIVDAGSLAVMFREWERLYLEPEVELPPLDLTFRDYIVAATKLAELKPYRRSLDYWTARSTTLPAAPQLPLAKIPRSVERPRFVRRIEKLDEKLWSRLKKQAAAAEVTPAILLATVFGEVLATWSRSSHFTLNLTLFNRLPLHPAGGLRRRGLHVVDVAGDGDPTGRGLQDASPPGAEAALGGHGPPVREWSGEC